jgi:hypothetical protein
MRDVQPEMHNSETLLPELIKGSGNQRKYVSIRCTDFVKSDFISEKKQGILDTFHRICFPIAQTSCPTNLVRKRSLDRTLVGSEQFKKVQVKLSLCFFN